MLRHEREAVTAALEDALAERGRARTAVDQIKQRTKRRAEADAILLPPTNFHLQGDSLVATFREFRSGERPPETRSQSCNLTLCVKLTGPRLGRNEVRTVHVDARAWRSYTPMMQLFTR